MGEIKNKVIIIGLDGGTWSILKPLMDEGRMPNLKKLTDEGVSGTLMSTIPPVTAPAWASFQTGVNPGKHGLYDFLEYRRGTYDWPLSSSYSLKLKTIWELASENGKTVVSVNVPMTYPPKRVKGAMIAGMMSPGTKSKFTYPPELYKEIVAEVGEYIIFASTWRFSRKKIKELVEKLIYIEKKRLETAIYLMGKYDWNLFMIHNQSLDSLQHWLWPFIERRHHEFSEEHWKETVRFYESLDNNIGKLLENLDRYTTVILMSDHGFGGANKMINLNIWLEKEGYLHLRKSAQVARLENLIRKVDFLKLRRRFLGIRSLEKKRVKMNQSLAIDWPNTKAFVAQGNVYGHIHLNCEGREKEGAVRIEGEYEEIREEVKKKLGELKDPETGKKVIKQVLKREEIYKGQMVEKAPDLMVIPEEGYFFTKKINEKRIFVKCKMERDIVGTHRENGIFVFFGNCINSDSNFKLMNIVDMTPTILYLINVYIPTYMDGRVANEIIKV